MRVILGCVCICTHTHTHTHIQYKPEVRWRQHSGENATSTYWCMCLRLIVCVCVVILHACVCAHWGQSPVAVYWSSLFRRPCCLCWLLPLPSNTHRYTHAHTFTAVLWEAITELRIFHNKIQDKRSLRNGPRGPSSECWELMYHQSVKPSFLVTLYHILSTPSALSPQRAVCQWQHGALGGPSTQPLTHLIRQSLRGPSQAYARRW